MSRNHWGATPSLHGRFVSLRPTKMEDVQGLAQAHDDPDTLKFFPYGLESEPPSMKSLESALHSGRQVMTQLEASSGRIIGTTSMYNMDELIGGSPWGTLGSPPLPAERCSTWRSKLLLLDHIFGFLEAARVEFYADDLNIRSRRALLSLGATEEGHLRKHARRRNGSWRTTVVYSVTDDDWPLVRANIENRILERCNTGNGDVISKVFSEPD